MATTARLPDALKQEAETYARGLGVSLNALLAFALRDYLDARRGLAAAAAPAQPEPAAVPVVEAMRSDAVDWSVQPAQGRRVPCPCGSRKPWKDCHGRKPKPLTISRAMA